MKASNPHPAVTSVVFYFEADPLNYCLEYSIILKIFVMFNSLQIVSSYNGIFLELTELKWQISVCIRIKNWSLLSLCLYFFLIILNKSIPRPCFMPVCFVPFCSNSPYQFTSLLNLHHVIFSLMPFGWFICIYLSLFFFWEKYFLFVIFYVCPLFQEHN